VLAGDAATTSPSVPPQPRSNPAPGFGKFHHVEIGHGTSTGSRASASALAYVHHDGIALPERQRASLTHVPTGSTAFAIGQVNRQVTPEGA
jgi:hypothetical protein